MDTQDNAASEAVPIPSRPRRRRFLLTGIFLLLTMTGIVVLAVVLNRPHYRTFVSPPHPKAPLAVSVEVPDSWKLTDSSVAPGALRPYIHLIFQPTPPTGLTRWWQEKVLRQDMQDWKYAFVVVDLIPREAGEDIDQIEQQAKNASPPVSYRRLQYPIGPALEVTQAMYKVSTRTLVVYPEDTPAHRKFVIKIACGSAKGASDFPASFSHMAESAHLVDK